MKRPISYLILLAVFFSQLTNTTAQTITTVVGTGSLGFAGDGGAATAALLNSPRGIAFDASGNMYLSDLGNYRIRKVSTSSTITTIAGTGSGTPSGDGGPAIAAGLTPFLIAVDAGGSIYHADAINHYVRKIDASGTITTIAGIGGCTGSGGGGVATATAICQNDGVAIDNSGNVIFSNSSVDVVYRITSAGMLSMIAGDGTAPGIGDGGPALTSTLSNPLGLNMDISGNLFFADGSHQRIRKINSSGIISTVAGTGTIGFSGDGGLATSAQMNGPYAVVADSFGYVFFSDRNNNRVRVIHPSGIVTTIAGNGTAAFGGDGGPATAAALNHPTGLALKNGMLYIVDAENNRVRRLNLIPANITGATSVCEGATVTLGNTTSGGTWSSSSVANATVGSSDGIITGIAAGTAIITYSAYGYSVTQTVNVIGVPAPDPITGAPSVCVSTATTLSNTTPGGTWSSSTSAISLAGGIVTGVSAGTSVVTYTVSNACGSGFAVFAITVEPLPDAGTISGPNTVCIGATATLSSGSAGGAWSTGDASVSLSGGVVTGVSVGTATITYAVTNICGTATTTASIQVIDCTPEGVATMTGSTLTLYPVPAGNELILKGRDIIGAIVIRDLFGRTLFNGNYNKSEALIDISELAPGTYFLMAGQRKAIPFLKK